MTRCEAKTLKGVQCKNPALEGSSRCKTHSKKIVVAKAPKKIAKGKTKKAVAKKAVAKKVVAKKVAKAKAAVKLSKIALGIEKNIQAGYVMPESDLDYYNLEKSGKLTADQIRVFQKLKTLKSIDTVEFNKKGTVVTFVIDRDTDLSDYNDELEVERAEKDIAKVLKGVPSRVKISSFDEEHLRWDGTISF